MILRIAKSVKKNFWSRNWVIKKTITSWLIRRKNFSKIWHRGSERLCFWMKKIIFIGVLLMIMGFGSGMLLKAERRPMDTKRIGQPFRIDSSERLSSGRGSFFSDPDSSGRLNTQRFALFIQNGQPLLFDTTKGELYMLDTDAMVWRLIDLPFVRGDDGKTYNDVEKLRNFNFIFSSN